MLLETIDWAWPLICDSVNMTVALIPPNIKSLLKYIIVDLCLYHGILKVIYCMLK